MAGADAVVLLSGGMDSATVLAMAIEQGFRCSALSIRYGQRHEVELVRAKEIAAALGARQHVIADVDLRFVGGSALTDETIAVPEEEHGASEIPATYVPARNTLFLSLALGWAEVLGAEAIFVGVNAVDYSGYPDCRPEYLEAFRRMAALATRAGVEGSPVRIEAPLLNWSKGQIVQAACRLGVPLERTVSCYAPDPAGGRCGRCEACRLRARGFAEAGETDRSPQATGLPQTQK